MHSEKIFSPPSVICVSRFFLDLEYDAAEILSRRVIYIFRTTGHERRLCVDGCRKLKEKTHRHDVHDEGTQGRKFVVEQVKGVESQFSHMP